MAWTPRFRWLRGDPPPQEHPPISGDKFDQLFPSEGDLALELFGFGKYPHWESPRRYSYLLPNAAVPDVGWGDDPNSPMPDPFGRAQRGHSLALRPEFNQGFLNTVPWNYVVPYLRQYFLGEA